MNFEVNTSTKTITLLSDCRLSDIELFKHLVGENWNDWTLSFKPMVVTVTKDNWFPMMPSLPVYPFQPYYVGDLPGTFGAPTLYPKPEIFCSTFDRVSFRIDNLNWKNKDSIALYHSMD